jgi:hypothetical protein
MVWVIRFLIAAGAAVVQWFFTPHSLCALGPLQALLSLAVFVAVTLVLVLVPWPRDS